MEADSASERLTQPEPPAEPVRSAWELIDEQWAEQGEAPMCM